jgi:hypothetical protein
MKEKHLLFIIILLLILLIFVSRKEGLDTNIDEEINVPVIKNELISRIQLNCLVLSGDAWINLGDITLRDRNGNQINYGNTTNVYFGNKGHWNTGEWRHQYTPPIWRGWWSRWGRGWNGGWEWKWVVTSNLPVDNLWDNDKYTMGHSSREVENLIININPVALGSVQITNRQDCCWHRIGNYELAIYNDKNEKIGYTKLDKLASQGKTIRYNMTYPQ